MISTSKLNEEEWGKSSYLVGKVSSKTFLSKEIQVSTEKLEAVAQRCSVKKVFLKTSQNSQENTCSGVFLK